MLFRNKILNFDNIKLGLKKNHILTPICSKSSNTFENNLSNRLIVQVMILSKQIAQASISTTGAIGQVTIQFKQILPSNK